MADISDLPDYTGGQLNTGPSKYGNKTFSVVSRESKPIMIQISSTLELLELTTK
jgi:hypothetical protein